MKRAYHPNKLHLALIGCLMLTACNKPEPAEPASDSATSTTPAAAEAPAFPERPFFGDTHLHTSYSMDAGAFGARLGPADAYRFAKGHEVNSNSGQKAKLNRALDWLVVADHSDGMGLFPLLLSGSPEVMGDPQGKKWHDMINGGQGGAAALDIIGNFSKGTISKAFMTAPGTPAYLSAWKETIKAAEDANEPGKFTAFIGYEWTSNTNGSNLHRNVIYRDGGDKASQTEPYTTMKPLGSDNPVDLWKWMDAYETKTGGRVLAIAHNGNLSNGVMFPTVEAFGKKLDAEYVTTRAKWERLYENTQTKGTGEAHPYLSPDDEFADFEIWDKGNLDASVAKTKDMLQYEYTRSALKNGLALERQLGVNPYKFGLVGSSDAHTGMASMEEDNFWGKTAPQEPSPERLTKAFVDNPKSGIKIMDWEVGASGYAAVWATENTREAIWDAMQRKETYATSGPRMTVRLFGGYDFQAADANAATLAKTGYAKGVPMGGDLKTAPAGKAPSFLVAAMKDAIGANLDRYQIVKGWLDKDGKLHEKVYDVAWSSGRTADAKTGKVPAVGSTVNVGDASYTNTIGAAELVAVWTDPEFDPASSAFYYGRVMEIPTPRWTAYDVKKFKNKPLDGTRMTIQERAYTSPIWYTPK
jgi:hypothetical protein